MAPKWFNMTPFRFGKLRRASLAAFLAFAPIPTIGATVDLSLSAGCPAVALEPARPSLPSVGYDLTSEDARIICHNPKRGTTAEFLVETVAYGNLAGKRIVSVLVDGSRWEGFAFVDDFGLTVWTKKRGGSMPFDRYAQFLQDLSIALSKGVQIEIHRID
jgi:hypothetical protein